MAQKRVLRNRTGTPRLRVSITTLNGLQSCGWLLRRLRSRSALQSLLQALGLDSNQRLYEAHYHGDAAESTQTSDLASLDRRKHPNNEPIKIVPRRLILPAAITCFSHGLHFSANRHQDMLCIRLCFNLRICLSKYGVFA